MTVVLDYWPMIIWKKINIENFNQRFNTEIRPFYNEQISAVFFFPILILLFNKFNVN